MEGRGRKGVAAPAQGRGNNPHVHLVQARPGHQVNPVFHAGQGEQDRDVLHVHQLVGHHGEVRGVGVRGAGGDGHLQVAEAQGLLVVEQVVEQPDLVGVQLADDQAGHGVQVGPHLEQVGSQACMSAGVVEEKVKDPVSS